MRTVILLVLSNVFMTMAWYGHLKHRSSPLWLAILASWGIAFFEYCLQVPANRYGYGSSRAISSRSSKRSSRSRCSSSSRGSTWARSCASTMSWRCVSWWAPRCAPSGAGRPWARRPSRAKDQSGPRRWLGPSRIARRQASFDHDGPRDVMEGLAVAALGRGCPGPSGLSRVDTGDPAAAGAFRDGAPPGLRPGRVVRGRRAGGGGHPP